MYRSAGHDLLGVCAIFAGGGAQAAVPVDRNRAVQNNEIGIS